LMKWFRFLVMECVLRITGNTALKKTQISCEIKTFQI